MRIRIPVSRRARRVITVTALIVGAFVLYALVQLYLAAA
jgi:hypothetical protein